MSATPYWVTRWVLPVLFNALGWALIVVAIAALLRMGGLL